MSSSHREASAAMRALRDDILLDQHLADRTADLRACPAFSTLSDDDLEEIARELVEKKLKKGAILFHEDCPWTGLFLVKSGRVKVSRIAADGREQILRFLSDGELIGLPAAFVADEPNLGGGRYLVTTAAISDSHGYIIPRGCLEKTIRRCPEVALRLLRSLSVGLYMATDLIADLSFLTAPQRIAALLLRLAEKSPTPGEGGTSLRVLLSRKDLARAAGTSEATAIRTLSRLNRAGLIRLRKGQIVLLDLRKLADEAGT